VATLVESPVRAVTLSEELLPASMRERIHERFDARALSARLPPS
jgi:hypothetical protein